jgi:hypothetical protein
MATTIHRIGFLGSSQWAKLYLGDPSSVCALVVVRPEALHMAPL